MTAPPFEPAERPAKPARRDVRRLATRPMSLAVVGARHAPDRDEAVVRAAVAA